MRVVQVSIKSRIHFMSLTDFDTKVKDKDEDMKEDKKSQRKDRKGKQESYDENVKSRGI